MDIHTEVLRVLAIRFRLVKVIVPVTHTEAEKITGHGYQPRTGVYDVRIQATTQCRPRRDMQLAGSSLLARPAASRLNDNTQLTAEKHNAAKYGGEIQRRMSVDRCMI